MISILLADVLRSAVSKIVVFPGYDSTLLDGDFSMLKLATQVDFAAHINIRPVFIKEKKLDGI